MAVVESVGYEGTVDYPDYGKGVVSGSRYSLDGASDLRPSRLLSGADRTVRVAAGVAQGWGIRDTCTQTDVQLDTVSSGVRWDLIVLRRDWSGEETSFEVVQGGSSRAIPSRDTNPGILDDQPIALVQITAGQQYPTDLVDLRCWAGDGGLVAVDALALDYLDIPGTRVNIGSTEYTRILSASGTASWDQKVPPQNDPWVSSPIANSGFNGTRRWKFSHGYGSFQAQGSRAGGAVSNIDLRMVTFSSSSQRPGVTCFGVCYVGNQVRGRAYITSGGEVHVDPFDIGANQTFQVYITWPLGN